MRRLRRVALECMQRAGWQSGCYWSFCTRLQDVFGKLHEITSLALAVFQECLLPTLTWFHDDPDGYKVSEGAMVRGPSRIDLRASVVGVC